MKGGEKNNMARNVKALNDLELHYIKTKYSFELQGDYIYVSYTEYNRKVVHSINENFILSTKVRKVTVTKDAIEQWIKYYKDDYSLIEVQNAINILIVTYQPVNKENIDLQLTRFKERETEIKINEEE